MKVEVGVLGSCLNKHTVSDDVKQHLNNKLVRFASKIMFLPENSKVTMMVWGLVFSDVGLT